MRNLDGYPNLVALVSAVLEAWPEHEKYLEKSILPRTPDVMRISDEGAMLVMKLAESGSTRGGIRTVCEDYKMVCNTMILEEEIYFRRHGTYRISTFEQAYTEYYSDKALMSRYMHGLLLSVILWANHANALGFYVQAFLAGSPDQYAHLEIGPGHGLLTYFAAKDARARTVEGWDISPGSVEATQRALSAMGISQRVQVICQDATAAEAAHGKFDNIVMNEVLEHIEDPAHILRKIRPILKPGGRILVNMPANSPAPDHLYLLRQPEETITLVQDAGYEIMESRLFPMTGYSVEKARRLNATINCCVIARRTD
jgi:2-polyprenyl-3-methyl-5-hydroxy-6-metoxy-1,4-benzoquinol methylase